MSERLVIGTRGSSLAVRQAEEVAGLLATARPALRIELREYNSSGDDRLDMPFTAQKVWRAMQSAKGGQA